MNTKRCMNKFIATLDRHPLYRRPTSSIFIFLILVASSISACSAIESIYPALGIKQNEPTAALTNSSQNPYPSSGDATNFSSGESYPTNNPYPAADAVKGSPKAGPTAQPTTYRYYFPFIPNQKPPFELQSSGIMAIQGFNGCNWTGVAGQVFDLSGTPFKNLIVHLEGIWAGAAIARDSLSGSATQYGPAGFEFVLGTKPIATQNKLWIQLRDANQKQLSQQISLTTYDSCDKNLILVNFTQVR